MTDTRPHIVTEHVPNRFLCNLCGGPMVRIKAGIFGVRCLICRSSFIHRALCHVFKKHNIPATACIYELSAHGAFYKYLKKRYTNLTTSDFVDTVPFGTMLNGKLIQNVERLTFFSESFDVVTSTEVFEHVADDLKGYREIYRVLKPGGKCIFTVPLDLNSKTVTRARLKDDGTVEHLLPPEYHGDYLRNGILAFRNYGYDITETLLAAGFSKVTLNNVTSKTGIDERVVECYK